MAISFLEKLFESWNIGDLRDHICISLDLTKNLEQLLGPLRPLGPYMYGYLFFFLKIYFNLRTFRALETSYISLWVLLKPRDTSWDLGDLRDVIYMAIPFLKILFESRDLHDVRDLICISLDLTKKLEQFLGPSELSGSWDFTCMAIYFLKKII